MRRLFFFLSRFRDAIEADLTFRGISLDELWRKRRWRKLLNLINHLPPNSYFNEAMLNDKETVAAMRMAQKSMEAQGRGDDRPIGPRVSQVSEEARRLGEVVATLQWLAKVIVQASPKFATSGSIGKITPYPKPVMIDPETGEWTGKTSDVTLKKNHEQRLKIAQEAAQRWVAANKVQE